MIVSMSAPIVGHFVWTATGSDGWSFCVDGYRVRWFCDFYRPFFRLYMDCAVLLALVLICSSLFCDCPYVYIFLGLFGLFTIMYGLTSRFRKVICTVIQMYLGHSCCLYIFSCAVEDLLSSHAAECPFIKCLMCIETTIFLPSLRGY
jgi:hypothetical protein